MPISNGNGTKLKRIENQSRIKLPHLDAGKMASGFLDAEHKIAFFKLASAGYYRETFEHLFKMGFDITYKLDFVINKLKVQKESNDVQNQYLQSPFNYGKPDFFIYGNEIKQDTISYS